MIKKFLFISVCLLGFFSLYGQQTNDDRLVRLISAKSAEMHVSDTGDVRLVIGPAQFMHNGAIMLCDTARWNLTSNIIHAIGHVEIIQNQTSLTSDYVRYAADSSLAQIRGRMVELMDKDNNRLRTHNLDYNTKDSLAYFFEGGSMMSRDSSFIESLRGYYDSKIERFKFLHEVEMFSDSLVLKTDSLAYWANTEKADFLGRMEAWMEDSFLTSAKGWYDRKNEAYFFHEKVYVMTEKNEVWTDTLFFDRNSSNARLYSNTQILDTTKSTIIFSDYAEYFDEPKVFNLSRNPSIALYSYEDNTADTLFVRADIMEYKEMPYSIVDSSVVEYSSALYNSSWDDPISKFLLNPSGNHEDTLTGTVQVHSIDSLLKASDFSLQTTADLLIDRSLSIEKLMQNLEIMRETPGDSLLMYRIDSLLFIIGDLYLKNRISSLLTLPPEDITLQSIASLIPDNPDLAQSRISRFIAELSDSTNIGSAGRIVSFVEKAILLRKIDNLSNEEKPIDLLSELLEDPFFRNIKDSLSGSTDSTAVDSLVIDLMRNEILSSVPEKTPPDVQFITALKNIRFHRSDFQGKCDSLLINTIDSTVRMYKDPVIWNESRQFRGDTVFLHVSGQNIRKAVLNTNAFVIIREDSTYFDQIKSLDFIAYFKDGELSRFDATGGVKALFFLPEENILTTMNERESSALSATLTEGEVEKLRSYGDPENANAALNSNAYPVFGLEPEKRTLTGFDYREEERPKSRFDVCDRVILHSDRENTIMKKEPVFSYTRLFFDIVLQREN